MVYLSMMVNFPPFPPAPPAQPPAFTPTGGGGGGTMLWGGGRLGDCGRWPARGEDHPPWVRILWDGSMMVK